MFPKTDDDDEVPFGAAVCAHYVRCGKKNCRCASGRLHGPYYLLCYRDPVTGKRRKKYVPKADVPAALRQYELRRDVSGTVGPRQRRREKSLIELVFPRPARGANLRAMRAKR
jgi:hypothetical protein